MVVVGRVAKGRGTGVGGVASAGSEGLSCQGVTILFPIGVRTRCFYVGAAPVVERITSLAASSRLNPPFSISPVRTLSKMEAAKSPY